MRKLIALGTVVTIAVVHHSAMGYFGDSPSPGYERLMTWAFSIMLALWCMEDAKERRFHRPYEFGAFLLFAWPLVLPAYLIRTRGWRGVAVFAVFVLLALLPAIFGWVSFYLGPAYEEYGG